VTALRPDAAVGLHFLKLGVGEAFARIVAFAATVYVARRLGADTYGIVVLATTVMVYVGRLADCGVDLLGVRDVAHEPAQLPGLVPRYLGARLFLSVPLAIVTAGVGWLVFTPAEGAVLMLYASTLLPIALGTRWVHIGLGRPGVVSIARGATEGLAALLIVALVHTPDDVGRVPLAVLAGETLGAVLLFRALPNATVLLRLVLRFEVVASLYRRSWPLVLHALLGLLIMNSDFFVLRLYNDSATVGHYAAAYALVSFFINLGHSYQMSLLPVVTRMAGDPAQQARLCQTASAQVLTITFPLALGGCLLADRLLPAVFGTGYLSSVSVLQVLIWSIPVAVTRNVVQSLLIARGRQDLMLQTSAWAAASNIGLNLLVIPTWGMIGAATVTLATEVVRLGPMLAFSRESAVPLLSLKRCRRPLLAGCVMGVVVAASAMPAVPSVLVGTLVYICTLWLSGGLRFRRGALPELVV
jgi:O-antigen/teichoic acid export membrane protein